MISQRPTKRCTGWINVWVAEWVSGDSRFQVECTTYYWDQHPAVQHEPGPHFTTLTLQHNTNPPPNHDITHLLHSRSSTCCHITASFRTCPNEVANVSSYKQTGKKKKKSMNKLQREFTSKCNMHLYLDCCSFYQLLLLKHHGVKVTKTQALIKINLRTG